MRDKPIAFRCTSDIRSDSDHDVFRHFKESTESNYAVTLNKDSRRGEQVAAPEATRR
jgi:hypothetical protein